MPRGLQGAGLCPFSSGGTVEGDTADLARCVINGEFGNRDDRRNALGGNTARQRDSVVTRQKNREEIAWGLAVLASGLLCLVILPLYLLCWMVDYFERRWEDK